MFPSLPRVGRVSGLPGAGLALAAKARYAPQPKLDPELAGLSMLNKDGPDGQTQGIDDVAKICDNYGI